MISPHNTRWMSFFEENLLEEMNPSDGFFWDAQAASNQSFSKENNASRGDLDELEKQCTRKRSREEPCSAPATSKAYREKMRRDRLNDRFMELSAILEPGKTPKTDKATILADAIEVVIQLRTEAQHLKESSDQLKEAVKELKAEKNELRDEKLRLKAEKEVLEQHMKSMIIPGSYIHNRTTLNDHVLGARNQVPSNKGTPTSGLPSMDMWRYLPPGVVDISKDHMLRPPVA